MLNTVFKRKQKSTHRVYLDSIIYNLTLEQEYRLQAADCTPNLELITAH